MKLTLESRADIHQALLLQFSPQVFYLERANLKLDFIKNQDTRVCQTLADLTSAC